MSLLTSAPTAKLKMRDNFDFHDRAFWQRGDLNGGARRKIGREIFRVNFVHAGEVSEVREKNGALDHVGKSQFLVVENRLHIFQNAFGLRFDIAVDEIAG